jgi:predicted TIM-barrel fold metal-dependent hydrolase
VAEDLVRILSASDRVRGVRWILDCDGGPYRPDAGATHVATTRHGNDRDGGIVDYLRGGRGDGGGGTALPAFERGFALLARHRLSFDLQCAPVQLLAAAALCARHPEVPVCIDHLGKPRALLRLGPDRAADGGTVNEESSTLLPDRRDELDRWRTGMRAMAQLPHVCVKISMLGYAVPGWIRTEPRKHLVRDLVRETVDLFGPHRCMVALNWWKDAATSDSGGSSATGPDPVQYLRLVSWMLDGYSDHERHRMFCGTAQEFSS